MGQTYFLYVSDIRYTVPTLAIIEAEDEDTAKSIATSKLRSSAFHESVEIFDARHQLVAMAPSELRPARPRWD